MKPLVRLPIFFVVLLAADIGAQVGRFWTSHHPPAGGAGWTPLAASLLLAAALLGIYTLLVRSMERRMPGARSPAHCWCSPSAPAVGCRRAGTSLPAAGKDRHPRLRHMLM
jgi:hypothetical protein